MGKHRSNSTQARGSLKVATSSPEERRRADRLNRPITIHYRWGERGYQRSQAVDFSRSGARVWLSEAVEPRDNLYLLFDLEPRLKLTVTAEMVWQQEVGSEGYLAGIRFALPRDVELRLDRWLTRQLKAS